MGDKGALGQLNLVSAGFSAVKGLRHSARSQVRLDAWGLVGDRELCLVDPVKRRVLRTVQHPALLAVRVESTEQGLDFIFPDGTSYSDSLRASGEVLVCDYWGRVEPVELISGPLSEVFSYYLSYPVRLARARRNLVFGRGLTLVGTASLEELGRRVGNARMVAEQARFRASFLVETDEPFIEESWCGREFRLADVSHRAPVYHLPHAPAGGVLARDDYVVRVGEAVPRCAVVDFNPVSGVKDARLLKELSGFRSRNASGEPFFGVFADYAGIVGKPL